MKFYVVILAAILMTVTLAGCAENYAEAAPAADPATQTEYVEGNDTSKADDPAGTDAEDTEDTDDADDAGDADDTDDTDDTGDTGDTGDTDDSEGNSTVKWPKLDKDAFDAASGRHHDTTNNDTDDSDTTAETGSDFGSIEAIAALGGKQATVQKDKGKCLVYIFDETKNHGNPYDVTWDYGKVYDSYVTAADWSLVFDAEYYKAAFPMLVVQYHNDDALLLKHFRTVGIHEGRQGSKGFNVAAYMDN